MHFVEVARRLPPELRVDMPVPPAEDAAAVGKFIAAVTERLMSVKRAPLKLAPNRIRKGKVPPLALAAQAEAPVPGRLAKKAEIGPKRTLRSSGK